MEAKVRSRITLPLPIHMLPEQARQQEIARLLDYIKNGELTLREAANIVDGLTLTNNF